MGKRQTGIGGALGGIAMRTVMAALAAGIWLALAAPVEAQTPCISISRTFPDIAYAPGDDFRVRVRLESNCAQVFALGMREQMPAGWTLLSVDAGASAPQFVTSSPPAGGAIEFAWFPVPAFPLEFTYTLQVPASETQNSRAISGQVLYRVLDGAQETTATSTTTAQLSRPPVITLNGSPAVTVGCNEQYTELGATALDPVEGDITTQLQIGGDVPNTGVPGVYTVRYTVSNSQGKTAEATRTVTVRDDDSPTITLLGAASVTVECGQTFVDPGASAQDTCDGDISSRVQRSGQVPNVPGTYTLIYTVQDTAGNGSLAVTRTVRVVDTAVPVITLIGAATLDVQCGSPYVDPGKTATDACDGNLTADVVVNASAVNTAVVGNYTVTYNVTDSSGNRAQQVTRTVRVVDTVRPVITLNSPGALTRQCGAALNDPGATAFDACAGPLPVTVNTSAVNLSRPGTYTITYTATDGRTQPQTATRTVNVVDNTPPVLTLLGDGVQVVDCGTAYQEAGALVTDNCDTNLAALINAAAVYTNKLGTYRVDYSATDSSGNRDSASRLVVVADLSPPVITLNGPNVITLECTAPFTDPGATAVDSCDGDLTARITKGGSQVNPSQPGEYTITYTVTDTAGNTGTASRLVRVVDSQRPVIRVNGGDETIPCGDVYQDLGATASDVCDGDLSARITTTGAVINTDVPGVYTVTYFVRDNTGNSATATRTVFVDGSFCPPEGEGEGDPSEGEGEEGEPELPVCSLQSVRIAEPPANVIVPSGTTQVRVPLRAEVTFASDPPCQPGSVSVVYAIDGVSVGTSTNAAAGYPGEVSLGLGAYVLAATAVPAARNQARSDIRFFSVLEAIDEDGNGILDNPFANMPGNGDFWSAVSGVAGSERAVVLRSWLGDGMGGFITAEAVNPQNPGQRVIVRVRRDLLAPNQQGVLILSISGSLGALYAPYSPQALINGLPAGPVGGEAYIDVSIVVSSNGGQTYELLEDVVVDGQPAVEITYEAPTLTRGLTFRAHPSNITRGAKGLELAPAFGAWTRFGVENVVSQSQRLSAKLRHLSTLGAFVALDLPAELSVSDDDLAFGAVRQGETLDKSVTVQNLGDDALDAALTVTGAGYSLVGAAAFTLAGGESRDVTVRFAPNAARTFNGELTVDGGDGGDAVVALGGVGVKANAVLGCGSVATPESRAADLALMGGVLLLLVLLAWRRRGEPLK